MGGWGSESICLPGIGQCAGGHGAEVMGMTVLGPAEPGDDLPAASKRL